MKNLAQYSDPENIGSVHWFRTIMGQSLRMAEFISTHMASTDPAILKLIREYSVCIIAINKDLIEWQEVSTKPLFYRNSDDVAPNELSFSRPANNPKRLDISKVKDIPVVSVGEGQFEGKAYKSPFWFDELALYYTSNKADLTCTEAKGNNSTFLIHKPGNVF